MLSPQETDYYMRQLSLPEWGIQGQSALKHAKVLVVGAGGLGCPALLYLAAAGVGTLGVIDADRVTASNLHRQVLYTMADIGRLKATAATEALRRLNPHIQVNTYPEQLDTENALRIMADYDLVVDGSDNFPTRYLVNDACVLLGLPWVFGAIYKFEGQVTVFNLHDGPTYRCLFPTPPMANEVPNCAEVGVLGVLPGVVGSLQAAEVLKILTRLGEPLSGKLLVYDSLRAAFRTLKVAARPESRSQKGLRASYGLACATDATHTLDEELTYAEFCQRMESATPPFLIDVREPHEHEQFNLGGVNWPLRTLNQHLPELHAQRELLLYCQSGIRSRQALQWLQEALPQHAIRHLAGGVNSVHLA